MDFVVNDPRHFAHELAAPIQHAAQNFRRHDQGRRRWIDGNVPRHQSDVRKLFLQVPKFLVRQGLDGRRVHDALTRFQGFRHGVFRHGRFARTRVGRDQDGFFQIDVFDCLCLEGIEGKGIGFGRFRRWHDRCGFHVGGQIGGWIGRIGSNGFVVRRTGGNFFGNLFFFRCCFAAAASSSGSRQIRCRGLGHDTGVIGSRRCRIIRRFGRFRRGFLFHLAAVGIIIIVILIGVVIVGIVESSKQII
mmetsp:Transcript_17288/g.26189  ORF Transcript_17288/g.26189 Transcript_17288/m.26189 type:complete len:246 (+) Transcript_17288:2784-3521(+)